MQDAPSGITLGILAGGQATRLGGLDKAWLRRSGVPQVLRVASRFQPLVVEAIVSANRDLPRYTAAGLRVVADRQPDIGPLAGLDALARACATPWLLTLPVDLVDSNDCLLPSLRAAGGQGAFAIDDDGPQPLVALWRVEALRDRLAEALASGNHAVHALQRHLGMVPVRFEGLRFGNLNTPGDLRDAGIEPP